MSTIDAASRHDLTDGQWELLEPLLPDSTGMGRPRRWPLRGLIDGARHRIRVGCPWRDVPDRYGPWWRLYALFACWQLLGVWERIEQSLIAAADAAGKVDWQVSVDSTTARAHVHAAGARRDSSERIPGEPTDHAFGRSRGGWTTKIHLACEQRRHVLGFVLTPGQAHDSPQMIPVLETISVPRRGPGRPRTRPDRVLGDKAYSSPTPRSRTAPTWPAEGSRPPSRSRTTKPGTVEPKDQPGDDRRSSTPRSTAIVMPSSAASTPSNTNAPSPPATTSSPSATPPPSASPTSTAGSNDFRNTS